MKAFSSEQIEFMNSKSTTGRFVEAVVFTRDQENPEDKDYFIRLGNPISFQGNIYTPIDMSWSGIKITASMELPTNQITLGNLGGQVIDYIEGNGINIEGNDVLLQELFIDKFNSVSLVEEMLFQVETIVADYHTSAVVNLGVNYSLNDILPKNTIETQEYPGLKEDVIRVGT